MSGHDCQGSSRPILSFNAPVIPVSNNKTIANPISGIHDLRFQATHDKMGKNTVSKSPRKPK